MAQEINTSGFAIINGPGVGELVDALKYAYRDQKAEWSGEAFGVDFTIGHPVAESSTSIGRAKILTARLARKHVYRLRITGLRRSKTDPDIFYYQGETDLSIQFAMGDQEVWGTYDTRKRTGSLNPPK